MQDFQNIQDLQQTFNLLIEVFGTLAFAISGAFAAMDKRFDPFGVLIIAFITATGGGTMRDMMLGVHPFWMNNMLVCTVILLATFAAFFMRYHNITLRYTLFIFDSFGLGLFTIVGLQKGFAAGLNPAICVILGTMTGSFGGVIRDVLLNRIPLIFRKEIYASASILGGTVYFLLTFYTGLSYVWIHLLTILLIVSIRTLAVNYGWAMPKIYLPQGRTPEDQP